MAKFGKTVITKSCRAAAIGSNLHCSGTIRPASAFIATPLAPITRATETSFAATPVSFTRRLSMSADVENTPQQSAPSTISKKRQKKTNSSKTDNVRRKLNPEATDDGVDEKPWYFIFTKGDSLYSEYMANEWGIEKRGDNALFEKLCLEGAQSGLSWKTILYKRQAYRRVFHNFEIERVAQMTMSDVDKILSSSNNNTSLTGNDMVVRHRGKLESVIHNAKLVIAMRKDMAGEQYSNFSDFLWNFVENRPILNAWKSPNDMPAKTKESEAMSQALKKIGFKYVGATTCYSLMQSCGFVIDHPYNTNEWKDALSRLQKRSGGFQDRR